MTGVKSSIRSERDVRKKSRQRRRIRSGNRVRHSCSTPCTDNPTTIEHKEDPGIPNDFPYKDQILAEIVEQRRAVRLNFCAVLSVAV